MTEEDDLPAAPNATADTAPTTQELKGAIDSGRTGDKRSNDIFAAAPLGTDDEAAGSPATLGRITAALQAELGRDWNNNDTGRERKRAPSLRPRSPNIQNYRPQLTSVLSILNRISGIVLSIGAVGLVVWLLIAATGPQRYAAMQSAFASWTGRIILFAFTYAFFLHLCGGIRHLVWDAGNGFALRSIYISGWIVIAGSVVFTVATWACILLLKG